MEYSLTPLGKEAAMKVRELADWIEGHYPEVLSQQDAFALSQRR